MRKLAIVLVLLLVGILTACVGPAEGTAEWYLDQGNKLYDQGRYDEAIEEYSKAIELDQGYVDAYYNRGYAYINLGEYQEAIADFNQTIEINPNMAMTYFLRGIAYEEQGKKAEAIADFEKVITLTDDPWLIEVAQGLIEALSE